MTEAEWLGSIEPVPMLEHLRGRVTRTAAGRRKLRLLACACVRRFWEVMRAEEDRDAVRVAERYADGRADKAELLRAREVARNVWSESRRRFHESGPQLTWPAQLAAVPVAWDAATSSLRDCALTAWLLARDSKPSDTERSPSHTDARRRHAELVRDLFGNPFRPPPALDPAWLSWNDGTVRRLAEGVYEDHAFDRLPILADALEDAGCDAAELLSHLRGPGPHARGCWPLDLVLGK